MGICINYPELLELSNEFLFVLDANFNIVCVNEMFANKMKVNTLPVKLSTFIDDVDYSDLCSCVEKSKFNEKFTLTLAFHAPDVDSLILKTSMLRRTDSYIVCNASDFTKMRRLQQEKYRIQYFDELTGGYNVTFIRKWLDEFFSKVSKDSNEDPENFYAFFAFELDGLVSTDDLYGRAVGDKLLCSVVERIRELSNDSDILARLTNGTICVIKKYENLESYLKLLTASLNSPFIIEGNQIILDYHIGITIIPRDVDNAEDCLRYTSFAADMTRKQRRLCDYTYFKPDMLFEEQQEARLVSDLKNAISNNELVLLYQPKIDLKSKELSGFEALIRWQHPVHGLLTPDKFIEIAEEKNIICKIGFWIINEACKQSLNFSKLTHNKSQALKMAINLSVKQLNEDLIRELEEILQETGVNPKNIEFEVTETLFVGERVEEINKILRKIRNMGFSIAIDDFGTGYSSFFYLKNMDIDTLKIDKSFVKELPHKQKDAAIAGTIINFAHDLGFTVVAEGIETVEQEDFLREHDCDYAQGYLFSKPVSAEKAKKIILEKISK